MVARTGTPREVITRLNQEINKAMQSTEVKTALEAQRVNIANGSPEDLAKKIAFESARWEKVVKTVGLTFE
jgi:tripartite-type tricarboxylate transporter receptor subunit TctC